MSAEETEIQEALAKVAEITIEPSYLSEIVRKLREIDSEEWNLDKVSRYVGILNRDGSVEIEEVGYGNTGGQVQGSPHYSRGEGGGVVETEEWKPYTVVHNETIEIDAVREEFIPHVDPDMTIQTKTSTIETLTGGGNRESMIAEDILKDVCRRQFREFSIREFGDYNSPGPDFYVQDEDQRDYGIVIEISTRSENPIDGPYIEQKVEMAEQRGADLLIMAPRFTNTMKDKYEDPDDPVWHSDPLSDTIHLHRVPTKMPDVYRPFLKDKPPEYELKSDGVPVLVPDSQRMVQKAVDNRHFGPDYPIVGNLNEGYMDSMDEVMRDYQGITESQYRNQIRESLEPMLGNFLRPYLIEQFLVDMYWDKSLTQGQIGNLVDRSGSTIGDWMSSRKWDIMTRGTGAPPLSQEVKDIWSRMYRGEEPFPSEFSGYRIQAEYNRHPMWTLEDWEEFYTGLDEQERKDAFITQDSYRTNVDYTVITGASDRLVPSYSFIIKTLKEEGVNIRPPDEAPRGTYFAYPSSRTVRYMLNRDSGVVASDTEGSQQLGARDAEVFDSYLEVDVADWLSDNEVPYAHEPFTVPSIYGPNRDRWENMVDSVRRNGQGEEVGFENFSAFELRDTWDSIYQKHRLQDQPISIEPLNAMAQFDKRYVIPDLVLYPSLDYEPKPFDWDGWDQWEYIVEVSGLYGVGLPEDAEESEWWRWYRVAGVAFKELAYKLLGLWDDVYYLIPREPFIEGVSQGTPRAILNDDHYITFNATSSEFDVSRLAAKIGITDRTVNSELSPAIELEQYDRELDSGDINIRRYTFDGVVTAEASRHPDVVLLGDDELLVDGYMGDFYIIGDNAYVKQSQYRDTNMLILREYVVDMLSELSEGGVIENLREI